MNQFLSSISETTVNKDPFIQFSIWFKERSLSFDDELYAASLATAGSEGKVSVRIVLVKEYNDKGFIFYTNYNSKKGKQLKENPFAALLFYWPQQQRQIRIEGLVEKVPDDLSSGYFEMRPRGSQIASVASSQSSVVPGRSYLDELYESISKKFEGKKVDRPAHWGGYLLIPTWFEFWQEGKFRFHDRISYQRTTEGWKIERLAP